MKNKNATASFSMKGTWMRQFMLAAMVCLTLAFQTGCDEDDDGVSGVENQNLYAVDRDFVVNAAQSNLSEIEMGKLAVQKATDADVKNFGQMMIDMHTAAQNQLKTLGTNKKISIPDKLNDVKQAQQDQLNALSGAAFDKAYINGQVTGHQVTSGQFQMEIDNGQDPELKAYAVTNKPVVDDHLQRSINLKNTKKY